MTTEARASAGTPARKVAGLFAVGAALFVSVAGCSDGFGKVRGDKRLEVELIDAERVAGTPLEPRALKINEPEAFRIRVRALDRNGNVDTSMNGFVRISAKPGAIDRLTDPDTEGRNVKLTNGESPEIEVQVTNAYGATFILADDLGYQPKDPIADPPPACANGKDDDGDGAKDFPTDEGCAFANDDSEEGGTYAQGASPPIYYQLPRIADIRGLVCNPTTGVCSGDGRTAYPKEQLQVDTGYHQRPDGTEGFDFDLVVIRISTDGFYVSDIRDTRGGFNSVFVFNFNAPPRMRVCDRLKTFAGTATEFFGFTQISYPTWTLEEWDPQQRPCLVPEPIVLGPADVPRDVDGDRRIDVPPSLMPRTGSLVRVMTTGGSDGLTAAVTSKFGPGLVPEQGGVFVPSADASNCDFDGNGEIDFTAGVPEQRCAETCTLDPDCTEYSNFAARSSFRIMLSDGVSTAAVQADATAAADFKPLEMKGKPLKAFTGTLHFFSGGSQFTIEARCKDDIVVDLNQQPLPSDTACVSPRTFSDENPQ